MKKTRKDKREEEARIIAEMDAAMQELNAENTAEEPPQSPQKKQKRAPIEDEHMPERLHCKRCKTLMENGVCPTCGFTVYIPMKKERRNRVKVVVTAVLMAVFVVLFFILQFTK